MAEGVNQVLSTAFLEMDYELADNLKLYSAGKVTYDWIYDINHNDDDWREKFFNRSRDEMSFDDEWWQILHEAHVTWTVGNLMFRVGKANCLMGRDGFPSGYGSD